MKRLLVLALLAFPASASAGGFATINVRAPDGAAAGVARPTTVTVLQHGRTPLDGITPVVRISRSGVERSFPATPTGEPGQYLAQVVYPDAGRWAVAVDDGFTQTHQIMPVDVSASGAATAAAASTSHTTAFIAGGSVIALILLGSAWLLLRPARRAGGRGLRRSPPASAS